MAQLHCNFFSYMLGYGVDLTILLPSVSPCDMDTEEKKTHKIPAKYPVLYLLHGHRNDYMSWNRFTCIERYAEERRIVVVTFSAGNKGYMNAAYGERYFDFLEQELPEFITANFPVSDRPQDTYLAGASMGGYGTLAHALSHPEKYRAAGAFSPVTVWDESSNLRLGHELPEMMDLYQVCRETQEAGKTFPDLFICMGEEDYLLESADHFVEYLKERGVSHVYDRIPAYGHEWGFWESELVRFLDWLPRTDAYADMELHKM